MGKIGHGYGSEWHLLLYLGYHRQWFSDFIAQQIDCSRVSWLDFGFSGVNQQLRQDAECQGIEFVSEPKVKEQWRRFWPSKGQNWDAVGIAYYNDNNEWLLIEAKAHVGELGEMEGCGAISSKSIQMIRTALITTQKALGIEGIPIDCWMTHYYQLCNRYAALHFLRNICKPHIPARLLFLYFYGEPHQKWSYLTTPDDWQPYLRKMDETTGISAPNPLSPFVHRLFLPVHPSVS